MPSSSSTSTTTTTSTTSTTTTTTVLTPPLPSVVSAAVPQLNGTLCEALQEMAEFDAAIAAFYSWMFNPDGTPTTSFISYICAVVAQCAAINGSTSTTTAVTPALPDLLSWTTVYTAQAYSAVCISGDGTKMAAAVASGQIYISTNSGQTWAVASGSPSENWTSLSCSSDFTKIYGTVKTGQIYVSPDSGTTWNAEATSLAWLSVSASATGTAAYAVVSAAVASYWTTTNSGTTWTSQSNSSVNAPTAVCLSGDATTAFAVLNGGLPVCLIGLTPGPISVGTAQWTCCATNTNGAYLYTAGQGTSVLSYQPSGQVVRAQAPVLNWTCVACASNGLIAFAASSNNGQGIYESQDGGQTWTQAPLQGSFSGIACSADGSVGIACTSANGLSPGQLYLGTA